MDTPELVESTSYEMSAAGQGPGDLEGSFSPRPVRPTRTRRPDSAA